MTAVKPDSCDQCGSVDIYAIEVNPGETVYACNDCERFVTPRHVLTAEEVYNKCAEYYAFGLDQAQLEVKRKKLKAEVEQALTDWGAQKYEAEGFKASFRPGKKSIDHKAIAIQLSSPEKVKALEPGFTKVGKPYFQIDGPKI